MVEEASDEVEAEEEEEVPVVEEEEDLAAVVVAFEMKDRPTRSLVRDTSIHCCSECSRHGIRFPFLRKIRFLLFRFPEEGTATCLM